MNIEKLSIGANPPYDVNVVIEVPMFADPIKYEIDKTSNALIVDRFMFTAMTYPCNYGFIPHSLSEDGDPLDVLFHCPFPLLPNSIVNARPIGVLLMEDEKGMDEKIFAIPGRDLTSEYDKVNSIKDISESSLNKISHFFEHYKDLEKNKWARVIGWRDETVARQIIREAISLEQKQSA